MLTLSSAVFSLPHFLCHVLGTFIFTQLSWRSLWPSKEKHSMLKSIALLLRFILGWAPDLIIGSFIFLSFFDTHPYQGMLILTTPKPSVLSHKPENSFLQSTSQTHQCKDLNRQEKALKMVLKITDTFQPWRRTSAAVSLSVSTSWPCNGQQKGPKLLLGPTAGLGKD